MRNRTDLSGSGGLGIATDWVVDRCLAARGKLERTTHNHVRQIDLMQQLDELQNREQLIKQERSDTPARIKIQNMDPANRYTNLATGTQYALNILKMICYRSRPRLP